MGFVRIPTPVDTPREVEGCNFLLFCFPTFFLVDFIIAIGLSSDEWSDDKISTVCESLPFGAVPWVGRPRFTLALGSILLERISTDLMFGLWSTPSNEALLDLIYDECREDLPLSRYLLLPSTVFDSPCSMCDFPSPLG